MFSAITTVTPATQRAHNSLCQSSQPQLLGWQTHLIVVFSVLRSLGHKGCPFLSTISHSRGCCRSLFTSVCLQHCSLVVIYLSCSGPFLRTLSATCLWGYNLTPLSTPTGSQLTPLSPPRGSQPSPSSLPTVLYLLPSVHLQLQLSPFSLLKGLLPKSLRLSILKVTAKSIISLLRWRWGLL